VRGKAAYPYSAGMSMTAIVSVLGGVMVLFGGRVEVEMWRVGGRVRDVESSVLNKEQLNNHGLLACLLASPAIDVSSSFLYLRSLLRPTMFTAASCLAYCGCSTRFQRSDVARTSSYGTACLGLILRRRRVCVSAHEVCITKAGYSATLRGTCSVGSYF
jgi:hypothetical protein